MVFLSSISSWWHSEWHWHQVHHTQEGSKQTVPARNEAVTEELEGSTIKFPAASTRSMKGEQGVFLGLQAFVWAEMCYGCHCLGEHR